MNVKTMLNEGGHFYANLTLNLCVILGKNAKNVL